jgi:hypothetical protein
MARDKAYLEAEKKIEEPPRLGTTELDLRNKWDAPRISSEKLTLILSA